MMVRMRPASMYSSTDSRGMLRSRSALTARSRSLGASARARATSSAPLGMLFAGAADDNVSTALMLHSLTRSAAAASTVGGGADALIVDRQSEPAYLEPGQVAHEKGVHPEPVELGDVAREQRLALLRGQVVAGDRLGRIDLH